jgi:hypothetical protein
MNHDEVIMSYRDTRQRDIGRVIKTFGCSKAAAELYLVLERRAGQIRAYDEISAVADDMFGERNLTVGGIQARLKHLRAALRAFAARTGVHVDVITHSGLGLELVLPPNLLRRAAPPEKPLREWTVDEAMRAGIAVVAGVVRAEVVLRPGQHVLGVPSSRVSVVYESEGDL